MILVNGQVGVSLDPLDRGLHYGDGLFETLYVNPQGIEFWDQHMQRLVAGCRRLNMEPPSLSILLKESLTLIKQSGQPAILKVVLTRGCGGRGYRPPTNGQANRIISLHPLPNYPNVWQKEGVKTRICSTLASINPSLAGMKHLNRLEQVLARAEWREEDVAEGLMFDFNDRLIEGTMSNVFLMLDGQLHTPRLNQSGVSGIMRQAVFEVAKTLNMTLHERDIDKKELCKVEAMFLTNSIIGVWPVNALGGVSYPVNEITQKIQADVGKLRQTQTLKLS